MNSNQIKTSSSINEYDDLEYAISEAIEHFSQYNIRFRTPNRNSKPTPQLKNSELERELS